MATTSLQPTLAPGLSINSIPGPDPRLMRTTTTTLTLESTHTTLTLLAFLLICLLLVVAWSAS